MHLGFDLHAGRDGGGLDRCWHCNDGCATVAILTPPMDRTALFPQPEALRLGIEPAVPLVAGAYRPRVMTADALSLIKRTVWLVPRTTTCITPEKPYSLL